MSTAATRRLHRELQLVQREPSWGVSAAPLSEDLYTWHCNVAGQPAAGGAPVILHLELTFSAEAWHRRKMYRFVKFRCLLDLYIPIYNILLLIAAGLLPGSLHMLVFWLSQVRPECARTFSMYITYLHFFC